MNKKVAMLIAQMIRESPYFPSIFHYEFHESKTNGFWGITLIFPKGRNDAHSASLFESLHLIGMVYGESLNITDNETHTKVEVD